ncbi:MAG: hypothetical protein KGN36_20165 [Acidobacteriota bacterium]|nr:hypothetical protein [Acidobacteriota bacterium]
MAFGKILTAGCLLALQLGAAEFAVRHQHLRKGCNGTIAVDASGIRFAGPKHHWQWKYEDIQRLTLSPGELRILTYRDSRLKLGADVEYRFTGKLPVDELYRQWSAQLDQRFVAAGYFGLEGERLPAKHLATIVGSQGTLVFAPEAIAWDGAGEARTWRYRDIRNLSSSGPFQLTITTFEKQFDFQLKQPLGESRYNRIWLDVERKNGYIQ